MKRSPHRASGARQRILDAAGEIFAEYGYGHVTVRDICKRAGVNVAAVNYYFRNKESLYLDVLKFWQHVAFRKFQPELGADKLLPEEHLRAFVRSFLIPMLEEGEHSWFGKLMAREFFEPTRALDMLVEEAIRPSFTLLSSIVRKLLGPRQSEKTVRLCCASIIGQCLYFYIARPVFVRLFREEKIDTEEIEKIADHITEFSLHAIKYRVEKKRRGRAVHSPSFF